METTLNTRRESGDSQEDSSGEPALGLGVMVLIAYQTICGVNPYQVRPQG